MNAVRNEFGTVSQFFTGDPIEHTVQALPMPATFMKFKLSDVTQRSLSQTPTRDMDLYQACKMIAVAAHSCGWWHNRAIAACGGLGQ